MVVQTQVRVPEQGGVVAHSRGSVWSNEGVGQGALVREPAYFFGLDLGKAQDYTAMAVIERRELVYRDRDPVTMEFRREVRTVLRHLQRVPLATPYPDVVEAVRDVVSRDGLAGRSTLVVDATGVGAPVVDLLRAARLPCRLVPVTITSGDRETSDVSGYGVPKRDLITGLQVAFAKRWLGISRRAPAADVFRKELMDMRLRCSPVSGYERYSAPGHDDLVMAAALAWWRVRRSWPGRG